MLDIETKRKIDGQELSVRQEFLNLCDEFSEFNDYCAFFCESVSLNIAQCDSADKAYAQGVRRMSRSISDKAQLFDEWLQRINSGLNTISD